MYKNNILKGPYLGINAKTAIYGQDLLELAKEIDKLAIKYDAEVILISNLLDLREIVRNTKKIIVESQNLDPIAPGRGMGKITAEMLKDAGAKSVNLNHVERPLGTRDLAHCIELCDKYSLISRVCVNSYKECEAVAVLRPNVIVCEEDERIGSLQISSDEYMKESSRLIRAINKDILVHHAGGVASGDDVYRIIKNGSDGTGCSSAIVKAADRVAKAEELIKALISARNER